MKESKEEVWKKLTTPAKKLVRFVCPPHFTDNKDGTGYVIEGTNKPFYPELYDEADYTIWIEDPFTKDE